MTSLHKPSVLLHIQQGRQPSNSFITTCFRYSTFIWIIMQFNDICKRHLQILFEANHLAETSYGNILNSKNRKRRYLTVGLFIGWIPMVESSFLGLPFAGLNMFQFSVMLIYSPSPKCMPMYLFHSHYSCMVT